MNKSYILRLVLAGSIVVVSCYVFYAILLYCNNRYFKAYERTQELFEGDTNYDVLFLGSSRMKNHANPKIVDSILQVNSFNGGQNAATVTEANLILKNYLATHIAPQLVVLGLDIFSLNTHAHKVGFYPTYLPFMENAEVNRILKSEGVNTGLLRTFTFLRSIEYDDYYKSSILKVALNQRELDKGDFYYKGFESNSYETIDERMLSAAKPYHMKVDPEAVESLVELVQLCKRNEIQLVFVYAPEFKGLNWRSVDNADSVFTIYRTVAEKYAVPFYRDDSLAISNDASLFRNPGHLNTKGAEVYSTILSHRLKPYLSEEEQATSGKRDFE